MKKASTILSLLMIAAYAALVALAPGLRTVVNETLGVHSAGVMRWQLWSFITYQFLHGSTAHLLLNLAALISVGPEIERAFGARRFLGIFFVSGMLGAAIWFGLEYPYDSVLIGASASICGLLGALVAWRPREKYTLVFLPLPLPAWLLVSALAATQIAYLLIDEKSHTAYTAHLAGGIVGWAYARIAMAADRLMARAGRGNRLRPANAGFQSLEKGDGDDFQ